MTLVVVEIDTFRAGDGVLRRFKNTHCSNAVVSLKSHS